MVTEIRIVIISRDYSLGQGTWGNLGGIGNVLYPDLTGSYIDAYVCKNVSKCTLKV